MLYRSFGNFQDEFTKVNIAAAKKVTALRAWITPAIFARAAFLCGSRKNSGS
jgi:hypothetical protein